MVKMGLEISGPFHIFVVFDEIKRYKHGLGRGRCETFPVFLYHLRDVTKKVKTGRVSGLFSYYPKQICKN